MKCSYCNECGHNIRTCSTKKKDIKDINENNPMVVHAVKTRSSERIQKLKDHIECANINHEDEILKEKCLKDAHIYCILNNLSAQQFGPLLEKFIRKRFKYEKNNAKDCNGDCCKENTNYEIKVSMGGVKHKKFNYVQIRPSHKCDMYILTAYHLSVDNVDTEGKLYIFKIPKVDMLNLLVLHGGYAHRTKSENGSITIESLQDVTNMKEYAIRPNVNDDCWKELLKFEITEDDF